MLTEAQVRKVLKDTMKSDQANAWQVDFDFRKEGALDSLDHVTFVLRLTEDYGLTVPDKDIDRLTSIRAVLDYAAAKGA
jgi:acyl carrier protein